MSSYPAEEPRSDSVSASGNDSAEAHRKPLTVPEIAAHKGSADPLVMVTAYDASSARAAEAGGAEIILVGDSLGMVVLGYDSTLEVTMDDMVRHTAAVTRSCSIPLVVADMPYMSYHTGVADAVRNAGRLIVEGKSKAVKVEGGRKREGNRSDARRRDSSYGSHWADSPVGQCARWLQGSGQGSRRRPATC